MTSYSHMYTFAFTVTTDDASGDNPDPSELREAIQNRLDQLRDDELVEVCGLPIDSYEL